MKLVKYSAVWCGPCRQFNPIAEKVAKELNLELEHVDIDKTPNTGIMSVPTTRLVKDDGVVLAEKTGAMSSNDFKRWIEESTPRFYLN